MLKWTLPTNRKTVQIYPSGKIQIMGKVTCKEAEDMRLVILDELRQALDDPAVTLTSPLVCTMTVSAHLPFRVNCHNLISNHQVLYEPEIFPAAILSYWKPVKVTLFPSGHVNITGLKNETDAIPILNSLKLMFYNKNK